MSLSRGSCTLRLSFVFCTSVVVWALTLANLVLADAQGTDAVNSHSSVHLASARSGFCPAFRSSFLFRSPGKVTSVNPSNWIQAIEKSIDGEEILLEDGVYDLNQYSVVLNSSVTIRSASGDRNSVVIRGTGYTENAEALMVMADDVHIADITIKDVRDHAISIKEGFEKTVIYNVNLLDIGTQHIKGNRSGPGGVIACSRIGYTKATATGDYIGAIDLHRAIEWTIRDNYIYNIFGDGSECAVDAECGTVYPGGGPAILIWQDSRDNIIERNSVVESFRAISLGLDTPYSGGVVRDNIVCRSQSGKEGVKGFIEGDAGISLLGANDVAVTGNRVVLAGEYPGAVELKDAAGISIHNNIISRPVWNRGNAQYNGCADQACDDELFGNIVLTDTSNVSCPGEGEFMAISLSAGPFAISPVVAMNEAESSLSKVEVSDADQPLVVIDDLPSSRKDQQIVFDQRYSDEQRLAVMEDRLKAKEERLRLWEERLIREERLRTIETRQRSTQIQIDMILDRVRALESERE